MMVDAVREDLVVHAVLRDQEELQDLVARADLKVRLFAVPVDRVALKADVDLAVLEVLKVHLVLAADRVNLSADLADPVDRRDLEVLQGLADPVDPKVRLSADLVGHVDPEVAAVLEGLADLRDLRVHAVDQVRLFAVLVAPVDPEVLEENEALVVPLNVDHVDLADPVVPKENPVRVGHVVLEDLRERMVQMVAKDLREKEEHRAKASVVLADLKAGVVLVVLAAPKESKALADLKVNEDPEDLQDLVDLKERMEKMGAMVRTVKTVSVELPVRRVTAVLTATA